MSNEWDDFAEMWDNLASEYADKAFAELAKITNLKGARVFDFGCGTGLLSERIAPDATEIIALDNSEKMTALFRKKNLSNVTVLTELLTDELIQNNPELQSEFDIIVASSVCGFLPNYEESAKLLSQMIKPGGLFIQWDWLRKTENGDDGLSEKEVNSALTSAGFTEITLTTPFEIEGPNGSMTVLMAAGKK